MAALNERFCSIFLQGHALRVHLVVILANCHVQRAFYALAVHIALHLPPVLPLSLLYAFIFHLVEALQRVRLELRDVARLFRAWDAALTPSGASRRMPALRGSPGRSLIAALEDEGTPLAELLTNDLEPVATQLRPAIQRIRDELERLGARTVAMSGSGPTVFGLFRTSEQARAAASMGRFDATDRVLVARTVDASARWGVV